MQRLKGWIKLTIKNILCKAFDRVYFAEAAVDSAFPYVVYMPDDENGCLISDNKKQSQAVNGTIDLFCRYESSFELFSYMQSVLNCNDISYRLNSTNYEREQEVVHFEWEIEAEVERWLT